MPPLARVSLPVQRRYAGWQTASPSLGHGPVQELLFLGEHSALPGPNFGSLLIPRRLLWVVERDLSASFSTVASFAVSPLVSAVMSAIRLAPKGHYLLFCDKFSHGFVARQLVIRIQWWYNNIISQERS